MRMRDGCKWVGCCSVVGFVSSSVNSVGASYQSNLFCDTHDREKCLRKRVAWICLRNISGGGFWC